MRSVRFLSALMCLLIAACAPKSHPVHVAGDPAAHVDGGGGDASKDGSEAEADASAVDPAPPDPDGGSPAKRRPRVIVMIGDGMGAGQIETASRFAHGEPDALFLASLAHHGQITTGGPSGITDSAAAATVMATGVYTYNGQVAIDRAGNDVETLVEVAHRLGLGSGIVSTACLPHATPASFSAHDLGRGNYVAIADDQALVVKPHVMLGGGARYFFAGDGSARTDAGLEAQITQAGYRIVRSRAELRSAPALAEGRLFGVFAPDHMTYSLGRSAETVEPTLSEMAMAAIDTLSRHPRGFFLMIEGARIDMASHGNDLANTVGETLAFDDAVRDVAAWARREGDVTLIVTADHETGGLAVVTPKPAGTLSDVSWRWGRHTNARVDLFAEGPGTQVFDGALRDHRWVHAVSLAALTGKALVEPAREPIPDGHLAELRHLAAIQTLVSSFDPARARLDALRVDASSLGLFVGLSGLFTWDQNAVVLLLDVDYGEATGLAGLRGQLQDATGVADSLLSASNLSGSLAGFGADFALVSLGGADPELNLVAANAGLRGLRTPFGEPDDLGWFGAAFNFGEGVRTREPAMPHADEGLEIYVPWTALYPSLAGKVPPGARLGVSAVLVNSDGGYTSNQALPSFPASTVNPARSDIALPGVVVFEVDTDLDGVGDGSRPPSVVTN